jgi:hypothetical protein
MAFWTPAEDAVLREHYRTDPRKAEALLPHRTRDAVAMRALRNGWARPRRWTERETATLQGNWGTMKLGAIAKLLGRTVTAVWLRARKLGLGVGCPVGFEYVDSAAKRTGYDHAQLRIILRTAGVRISTAESLGTAPRRRYVDPFDVDAAVAKWLESETVESGARRHNVAGHNLRNWLRAAAASGVKMPREPGRFNARWRVPSKTIDRVVTERRRLESVRCAARRLGVNRRALTRWLLAAGVQRPGTKYWLLQPGVADKVVAARMAKTLRGPLPAMRRAA